MTDLKEQISVGEYIDYNEYTDNTDSSREERRQRMRRMQQRKQKQLVMRGYMHKYGIWAAAAVVVVLAAGAGSMLRQPSVQEEAADTLQAGNPADMTGQGAVADSVLAVQAAANGYITALQAGEEEARQQETQETVQTYEAWETENTQKMSGEIGSSYGIFLSPVSHEILAQREASVRMNPASMTKVLTVLVAAEHIDEAALDEPFTITLDITDYGYAHDCSSAGFERDEVITVRDLFYGTILPSGADAAMGLAVYAAGDHESFVAMMNQKLEQLGLSQTAHVTNCVGVYDEQHYCTVYDMAMIMEAALDNELCREVMTAHTYTTSATQQHPEGMILSNWFLRRIEDRDTGGEVICAKTGYVKEAGSCAVSYGRDRAGNEYICVTAGAENQWKCISDHEKLYKEYARE